MLWSERMTKAVFPMQGKPLFGGWTAVASAQTMTKFLKKLQNRFQNLPEKGADFVR